MKMVRIGETTAKVGVALLLGLGCGSESTTDPKDQEARVEQPLVSSADETPRHHSVDASLRSCSAMNVFEEARGEAELYEIGQFFATIALKDAEMRGAISDVKEFARAMGVKVPAQLARTSIELFGREPQKNEVQCRAAGKPIVLEIPLENGSGSLPPELARKFNQTFKACATVPPGARLCASVSVTVSIGWDGVSGSVSATVSVSF